LASDDDAGPGLGSQIDTTFTAAGTYYVRVRHYDSGDGSISYIYNFSITTTP
jgi:hypothetical protein